LTVAIQQNLDAAVQRRSTLADAIKAEILRLERQAGNLVRVLAEGGDSPAVREELRTIEAGLRGLRIELAGLDQSAPVATPQVDSVLVKARLERLHTLFQQDVARARVEAPQAPGRAADDHASAITGR
jgi:hypothetical protein